MIKPIYFLMIGVFLSFAFSACASDQPPQAEATQPPTTTDLAFEAAVKQAQDSLDIFTSNLLSPKPSQSLFALKVRFNYPDGFSEDIWVDEVWYEDGEFNGNLFDIGAENMGTKPGATVQIPKEDILDWMFLEDNVLVGGYTIRLAYERMTPEEKEIFLKDVHYQLE